MSSFDENPSDRDSHVELPPPRRPTTRMAEFSSFNAVRLYNQDMYNFLMNADLGPVVEAKIEDYPTTPVVGMTGRVLKFRNLTETDDRLQDDLMCLSAKVAYGGQDVVLSQKHTLGNLLAVNCFWELYNLNRNEVHWNSSKIPLSRAIRKYLGSYLDNIELNEDRRTVTFRTLVNIAHKTVIADVRLGSSRKWGEEEPTLDIPESIMFQATAFLLANVDVEGRSMTYETYIKGRLGFLEATSSILQDVDARSPDAYALIALYDNYVAKKAYQNILLRSARSNVARA